MTRRVQSTAPRSTTRVQLRSSARRRKPLPSTKSPYFPHPSEDESGSGEETAETSSDEEFEGGGEDVSDSPSGPDDVDVDADDSPFEDAAASRGNPKKRSSAAAGGRGAVSSHGAKRQKHGRRMQDFVPYRPPSPGDTEYLNHTIHPNTLDFLKGGCAGGAVRAACTAVVIATSFPVSAVRLTCKKRSEGKQRS